MVHAICRPSQRIATLDILQGLVLLGLLIAQVFEQLASPQSGHSLPLDAHQPDLPIHFMAQLLVSGQFERMGSFLVGLGLYRYWEQADLKGPLQAGMNANRIVRRLLSELLGIGVCLSLLHSSVDLLVPYAGLGFTLLYVREQSVKSLLSWIVGLALLTILLSSGQAQVHTTTLSSLIQAFSCYITYELMMLGGLLVGKLGIDHRDPRMRVRLSLVQLGLLPTALLVKGVWVVVTLGLVTLPQSLVDYQPVLLALSGFLGPLLLTGVYLLDVGVNARWTASGWTRWIGRVGQLSLTNYVLQSLVCPLLLYGYGVVVGPIPVWGRAGIVVCIFGLQLGFSHFWRKRYEQGPLEWVCYQWIYRKCDSSTALPIPKL